MGMWRWGLGRRPLGLWSGRRCHRGWSRRCVRLAGGWAWRNQPAAWPNGKAAGGFWPDAEGAGWEVFRGPVPEGREGSAYHPANARSILSLFEHLAMVWALGGHPETSAHPGAELTRLREAGPLWAGDGLVGEKTLFACGTGPAGDGVACPEEYSGLAAAGVTPWSCTPGIPDGIWKVSATANPRRCINYRRPRALRTTGRPWSRGLALGKFTWLALTSDSSPVGPPNKNPSRFRPERGLSYPFLPLVKMVPVMRNRLGIPCSPDTGLRRWVFGVDV